MDIASTRAGRVASAACLLSLLACTAFAQDSVQRFETEFDAGDGFAALGDRVAVSEDGDGQIVIHRVSNGGLPEFVFSSGYDRGGDRLAADGDYVYVAEDATGLVDIHDLRQNGALVRTIPTAFDQGDGLAAGQGRLFVAEDDGGWIDVYDAWTAGWLARFPTTYDSGDDIAAAGHLVLVAEDDGGWVDVHNAAQGWRALGHFATSYDRGGDRIGAYLLGTGGHLELRVCVAEDDGGVVECSVQDAEVFSY